MCLEGYGRRASGGQAAGLRRRDGDEHLAFSFVRLGSQRRSSAMFGAAQQGIQHDRPFEHDPRGDGPCPNRGRRDHFRALRNVRGASPSSHAARKGQVVVMDNLSAHKGERVKELIEGRGCELIYLPSYSPDFNPIEEAFSKIKDFLRKSEARTREALVEAIGAAISAVTAKDACGFFEHCGYGMTVQSLW